MTRDERREAKLRDAKRRAGWTIPLEHYYPPDRPAGLSQGATGMVQASPSEPRPYTVEPVTGGCDVIRPRFGSGAGIRFRERKGT